MEFMTVPKRTSSPGQLSSGQVSFSSVKSGSHKRSPGQVSVSEGRVSEGRASEGRASEGRVPAVRRLSRKPSEDPSKTAPYMNDPRQRAQSKRNVFEAEEILSRVLQGPGSVKGVLFVLGILFISALGGMQTTFHGLTGHVPYTHWTCIGTRDTNPVCFNATQGAIGSEHAHETNIFNKTTVCSTGMKAGLHFDWDTQDDNFFSTEWGLYCNNTAIKDLVVQVFFIGSACGTLVGGVLYDNIGRRTSALIGLVIAISSTTTSTFAPTAYHLMIFRFFQGMSLFIYFTAVYIYVMEICPPKFRVAISTFFMVEWSLGTMITLLVFTLVQNWGVLLGVIGGLLMLSVLPILYGPDSPRFKLVTLRREAEARKELELLFGMNGIKFLFETQRCALTFHEQRMDEITGLNIFRLHPKFVRQIGVLFILWFVIGFSYYGFGYSVGELSNHIYISTLYSAVGEVIANLITIAPLLLIGRKLSCQLFFLAAGVSFVMMMFPFPSFSGVEITVQELTALLGYTAVAAAFSCVYLYTFELTPTTHRGRIFSACQFLCRIGSFLGTKSSAFYESNKFLALVMFAVMSLVCVALLFTMPVTKNRPTPDVPIEVEKRRVSVKAQKAQRSAGSDEPKAGDQVMSSSSQGGDSQSAVSQDHRIRSPSVTMVTSSPRGRPSPRPGSLIIETVN